MVLTETKEFGVIGGIVGLIFVVGVIYFIKILNKKSAHTFKGGRRKRARLIIKKRR